MLMRIRRPDPYDSGQRCRQTRVGGPSPPGGGVKSWSQQGFGADMNGAPAASRPFDPAALCTIRRLFFRTSDKSGNWRNAIRRNARRSRACPRSALLMRRPDELDLRAPDTAAGFLSFVFAKGMGHAWSAVKKPVVRHRRCTPPCRFPDICRQPRLESAASHASSGDLNEWTAPLR